MGRLLGRVVASTGSEAAVTNTGNGVVTGLLAPFDTVTETWTLVCTVAALNAGTFSVTGSIQGALANATVGVAYDNTFVAFTIGDGAADWVVGDTITIEVIRDIETPLVRGATSIIQVNTGGVLTVGTFDILKSLDGGAFFPVDAITLAGSELTSGKLFESAVSGAPYTKVRFNNVTSASQINLTIIG